MWFVSAEAWKVLRRNPNWELLQHMQEHTQHPPTLFRQEAGKVQCFPERLVPKHLLYPIAGVPRPSWRKGLCGTSYKRVFLIWHKKRAVGTEQEEEMGLLGFWGTGWAEFACWSVLSVLWLSSCLPASGVSAFILDVLHLDEGRAKPLWNIKWPLIWLTEMLCGWHSLLAQVLRKNRENWIVRSQCGVLQSVCFICPSK